MNENSFVRETVEEKETVKRLNAFLLRCKLERTARISNRFIASLSSLQELQHKYPFFVTIPVIQKEKAQEIPHLIESGKSGILLGITLNPRKCIGEKVRQIPINVVSGKNL